MSKINIRKRGKYYEYRVEIAHENGKRKWISKSGFKTKLEAQESGVKAFNEYLTAGVPFKSCDLSYSDYLDYWVENYCKTNLRYNTIKTYMIIINKYLKPKIGKYKLSNITSVSLNNFINNLVKEYNYSKSYYKNILKVLKGSFRDACNVYGFIKYNPAITLRLPRTTNYSDDIKHVYTSEEIDKILKRFKNNSTFLCAFLTSCYTGMRTGEVFALTWEDIDFENNYIYVKHSVYDKDKDDKGRWFIGPTKTTKGTRKIILAPTLKKALLNYKKRQEYLKKIYGFQYKYYKLEGVYNEHGKLVEQRIVINKNCGNNINLIFTKDDGTYIGTDTTKYPYKIIHKELGINKCRFYDLRGTYATKILNSGVGIKEVASLLGHTDITTTENYYISELEQNSIEAVKNYDKNINSETINKVIDFKIENL